ncbi:hypothetical protein JB92DRAFT_2834876 [Gautieria morchelliformis]|nr:hypothetical protein JB92DRAFT_2834876 [Gautieria morchelliformis]
MWPRDRYFRYHVAPAVPRGFQDRQDVEVKRRHDTSRQHQQDRHGKDWDGSREWRHGTLQVRPFHWLVRDVTQTPSSTTRTTAGWLLIEARTSPSNHIENTNKAAARTVSYYGTVTMNELLLRHGYRPAAGCRATKHIHNKSDDRLRPLWVSSQLQKSSGAFPRGVSCLARRCRRALSRTRRLPVLHGSAYRLYRARILDGLVFVSRTAQPVVPPAQDAEAEFPQNGFMTFALSKAPIPLLRSDEKRPGTSAQTGASTVHPDRGSPLRCRPGPSCPPAAKMANVTTQAGLKNLIRPAKQERPYGCYGPACHRHNRFWTVHITGCDVEDRQEGDIPKECRARDVVPRTGHGAHEWHVEPRSIAHGDKCFIEAIGLWTTVLRAVLSAISMGAHISIIIVYVMSREPAEATPVSIRKSRK